MLSRSRCEGMTQTKPEAFDRISINILIFSHKRIYKGGMKLKVEAEEVLPIRLEGRIKDFSRLAPG